MKNKLAIFIVIITIIFPSMSFSYTREKVNAQTSEDSAPANPPVINRAPKPEDDYDKRMRSADALILAGYIISAAGGLTAIAGSAYVVAKNNSRTTGAIIAGSGAALALTGGILTLVGMHKRSTAGGGYYSLAPMANPETSTYGLSFATNF